MAGQFEKRARLAATVAVLTALAAVAPAFAQGATPGTGEATAAPQEAVAPAPFSRDCQVGQDDLLKGSPLPNVAAALKERRQVRILTIGAPSSAGRRAGRGGYADQVKSILEHAVKGLDVVMINRGVSGELADRAGPRIRTEVALNAPDLVLWQVGTSDALAYVPRGEIEESVVETVRWLKARNVDVVLVGLQYTDRMAQDENYRAVRELMRRVAAEENVMIVRRYEAQRLLTQAQNSGGGLFPDEFQQTEAGYACLAQYMARAITLGVYGSRLKPRAMQAPPSSVPAN